MAKISFFGKNVVITGASTGIGRAISLEFAKRGANLAMGSHPAEEKILKEWANRLEAEYRIKTWCFPVDLLEDDGAETFHRQVTESVGKVFALVNNAGSVAYGKLWEIPWEPQRRSFHLNLYVPLKLMHLFLPAMVERRQGVILNISSVSALQPTPFQSVYGATKAGLQSLSQGLRAELKGTGVTICTLNPPYTRTKLLESHDYPRDLRMYSISGLKNPSWIASQALKALEKGKTLHVPGLNAKIAHLLLPRLAPRWLVDATARYMLQSRSEPIAGKNPTDPNQAVKQSTSTRRIPRSSIEIEEFIFYGDDIRIERFPSDTRFLYANPPMTPIIDTSSAIARALDHPINARPLEEQLNASSRVTSAFDDPCLPIPLMRRDPRGLVIEEVLARLFRLGIGKDRINLICANGLHRKWTLKELRLILGDKIAREMAGRITCHDGTREERLIHLGATSAGMEVEINRAVDESDLIIYVNLSFTTMNGGWKSVLVGLGSWRSIRHHHIPQFWNGVQSIMDPDQNPMHQAFREMGPMVGRKYNIFQIECVLNNRTWPPPMNRILAPLNAGTRRIPPGPLLPALLSLASHGPQHVKRFVRGILRSGYQLTAVQAGQVEDVHALTLDTLNRQQNVSVDDQVDVLILGVPNLSPYSALSIFNPLLLRSLALGYLAGLFKGRPLVREGGVIVAYNPGLEKFHRQHHPSYIDFWNQDLEQHRDPIECWDELAEPYARNPEYIRRYQDDYAYHGTHPLMNWMWSGMALNRLSGVVLAGAKEPAVARKLGFIPAPDFETALAKAREIAGAKAGFGYQMIPPLFGVEVM